MNQQQLSRDIADFAFWQQTQNECDRGYVRSGNSVMRRALKKLTEENNMHGYAELDRRLVSAITEYDRKQATRKNYNIYALPQYLGRVHEVIQDISSGADVREAVAAAFTGRLLDACLKALGLEKSTDSEQRGGYVYLPASQRRA